MANYPTATEMINLFLNLESQAFKRKMAEKQLKLEKKDLKRQIKRDTIKI